MMYTNDPMLKSLIQKEARINGMYGYMVMVENHLVSSGLYQDGYESLDGPKEKKSKFIDDKGDVKAWHELEDLAFPHNYAEDFELSQDEIWRLRHMEEITQEKLPHEISKEVYFKFLDDLRKRVLSAYTVEQLYALSDECDEMDLFMLNRVEGWKAVKTTFERLESQFNKVESRLRSHAVAEEKRQAYLVRIGYVAKKEVAIAV